MTIEYKSKKSLSQSMIKSILNGVRSFTSERDPEGPAIRKGNMVDCLITEPDEFDNRFKSIYIPHVSSAKVKQMIEGYYEYGQSHGYEKKDFIKADNIIYYCRDIYGHYTKYKDLTIIETLKANGAFLYLDYLIEKDDEVEYVDEAEVEQAKVIVASLMMSPYTKFYVKPVGSYDDHYEIFNQEAIYFTYDYKSKTNKQYNLPSKALVDRIIVNHNEKTIQPIDIKTTNKGTGQFTRKIQEFRYDIQAYWYTYAIKNYWREQKGFDDYEVLDFLFVVENSGDYVGRPLLYKLSEEDMKVAQKGVINGTPGVEDGIELYLWHSINDLWHEDKIVLENNGIIETKIHAKQILP